MFLTWFEKEASLTVGCRIYAENLASCRKSVQDIFFHFSTTYRSPLLLKTFLFSNDLVLLTYLLVPPIKNDLTKWGVIKTIEKDIGKCGLKNSHRNFIQFLTNTLRCVNTVYPFHFIKINLKISINYASLSVFK